ncbi:MAG TPA: hypothetical protein VE258_02745, partial [Ktedonobacterales bacterium]|nr:hypothetical protein [Ktedonobacterales bacterium]
METEPVEASRGSAFTADAGPAALEPAAVEALLLNLDASLRVHARAHFFNWTQGLLQSLIRHEVLICALRGADVHSFRVDSFATAAAQPALFGELFQRDPSVQGLLNEWREHGYLPIACVARQGGALCGGEFGREVEGIGASEILAHGVCDADGQASSFFVFCCRPGTAGAKQRYLVQLALPALHAAWIRAQAEGHVGTGGRSAPAAAAVLTPREQE